MKEHLVICKKALGVELNNEMNKTKDEPLGEKKKDETLKKLYSTIKNIFDGVNRKSILSIELTLSIIKINEALKLFSTANNCIMADPWRFDTSKLRKNALTCNSLGKL
jgi:hypothetical protein